MVVGAVDRPQVGVRRRPCRSIQSPATSPLSVDMIDMASTTALAGAVTHRPPRRTTSVSSAILPTWWTTMPSRRGWTSSSRVTCTTSRSVFHNGHPCSASAVMCDSAAWPLGVRTTRVLERGTAPRRSGSPTGREEHSTVANAHQCLDAHCPSQVLVANAEREGSSAKEVAVGKRELLEDLHVRHSASSRPPGARRKRRTCGQDSAGSGTGLWMICGPLAHHRDDLIRETDASPAKFCGCASVSRVNP